MSGEETIRADAEEAFERLIAGPSFSKLEHFTFEGPLHAGTIRRHREALAQLSTLALHVLGADPDEFEAELPRLEVLPLE